MNVIWAWVLIVLGVVVIVVQLVLLIRARAQTVEVQSQSGDISAQSSVIGDIIKELAGSLPLGVLGLVLILLGLQVGGALDLAALFGSGAGAGTGE